MTNNKGLRTAIRAQLADLSAESVIVFGLDGVVRYWNGVAVSLYKIFEADAIGRNIFDLLNCSSLLLGKQLREQLLSDREWAGVVQRKTHAGTHIEVSVRWNVLVDANGEPDCISEFGTVLEALDTLAQLKVREERYEMLFGRMPVALMLADSQGIGRILRELHADGITDMHEFFESNSDYLEYAKGIISLAQANHEAVRLLGAQNEAEIVRRPVGYIWTDSPMTFLRAIIARYMGERQFTEETRLRTFDGRTIDVVFTIAFPGAADRMGRSLLCFIDITDLRSAEAQLKKIQTDFAQATRVSMVAEVMATVAHELNQPLAAIAINAEAARRWLSRPDPADDKTNDRITKIAVDAKRASDMIGRIRRVATKHSPAFTNLDLNEIVSAALLFVAHDLKVKTVKVTTNLAEDIPQFGGDRVQMQQVLVNLLTNSIDALTDVSANEKIIKIKTALNEAGHLELVVSDGGPGIPEHILPHVFEGFFTTKRNGLGMGLTICRSVVEAHGGEIHFNKASGAEVLVCIPAEGGRTVTSPPVQRH